MQLPRPRWRFRLRTLMLVVAMAAGASALARWESFRRQRAAYHAGMEAYFRDIDAGALDGAMCKRSEIEYHSRLKLEYQRPWWSFRRVRPGSCDHPRP